MWTPVVLTAATDTQKTAAFRMGAHTSSIGIYVPTIDAATISIEVYVGTPPTDASATVLAADQDTNWKLYATVPYTPAGTGDSVIGSADMPLNDSWCRLVSSVAQAGVITFKINQQRNN